MSTNQHLYPDELMMWERMKRLNRIKERSEREECKKRDNHWNFVAGTLVADHLKDILDIPVYSGRGASEKNADSFKPLENILVYLAEHEEFTRRLMTSPDTPTPDIP